VGISFEQITGPVYPAIKQKAMKTSFEEIKDHQAIYTNVKVSKDVFDAVMKASVHCPRLFQLMHLGCKEGRETFRLTKPYETKVWDDAVFRIWKYDSFEEDYTLAQQFNYEY
jgi:lactam utilization protein B